MDQTLVIWIAKEGPYWTLSKRMSRISRNKSDARLFTRKVPCNHANEVLLEMINTENIVPLPFQIWYLIMYSALYISCNLADI